MDATVTVIIPVYNGQDFIRRAVDSVLAQSHKPEEIIVVNDGSTDQTLGELAYYGHRIRVITTVNRGVSSARNTGIAASTSDWVAFLDADDVWDREKLARQASVLNQNPDVGLSCCNYISKIGGANAEKSHFTRVQESIESGVKLWSSDPLFALVRCNFIGTTSTVLIRRSVLASVGAFNPNYRQAEDYDLWIRLATVTTFHILPEVLVTKMEHDTNLTRNQTETYCYHEMVLENHMKSGTFMGSSQSQYNVALALAEIRYRVANLLFEARRFRDCTHYYYKALRTETSLRNFALFVYFASRKVGRILCLRISRTKFA